MTGSFAELPQRRVSSMRRCCVDPGLDAGDLVSTPAPAMAVSSDESTKGPPSFEHLDLNLMPRPFRIEKKKATARRNKTVKQIIAEAARKEASATGTQSNSGSSTPRHSLGGDGPAGGPAGGPGHVVQAAQRLSSLVLERNLQAAMAGAPSVQGPGITYSNIESAPSLDPSSQRRYCDITGLPALYTDPKTRLRYHNREVYAYIKAMPPSSLEAYLALRGANTVLK